LQAQVDDPVYFQAYHRTVEKERLYVRPEELVSWQHTGGFLVRARKRRKEGEGVRISVSRLQCKEGKTGDVFDAVKSVCSIWT
jgi:hypothetical protein